MTFEVFVPVRGRSGPKAGPPQVRVGANGLMTLNTSARRALGEPRRVILLFDQVRRAMAFQSDTCGSPYAYSVGPKSGQLSGKLFCSEHHIPEGRYPLTSEGQLLVADLSRDRLRVVS